METNPFNPDFQSESVESKIVVALERISEAFRVLLWNESKTYGLSPIQVQVLIFLKYHGEEKRRVSYLAQEFNMTKATISDAIKALETKQLISKTFVPEDTRSYVIHLSKEGKKVADKTAVFAKEILTPVSKLHSQDKEKLFTNLVAVIQHLNKVGIITLQRMCFTCAHYRRNHQGKPHFCVLLDAKLKDTEIRVDCAEHKLV